MVKFKAWHKELKEMFYFDFSTMWAAESGDEDVICINKDSEIRLSDRDLELMQWTGLKDRNDADIYHKDILRHYQTEECYIIEHIESEARFALRKIGCNTEAGYKLMQDNMHIFEVINNASAMRND